MRSWLADGEQVLIQCRPHSRILVWPITFGLLLVMAASAALAKLQPAQYVSWAGDAPQLRQPAIVLVLTAVLLIEIAYPLRRVLRWAGTRYVLTSRRVVVRQGNLGRVESQHVLEQVENITVHRKLWQRPVGAGDLQFHMVNGKVFAVRDVPYIGEFHTETNKAWMNNFRASFQQAPRQGYYADEVDLIEDGMSGHLTGKGLRKLGRDN